MLRKEHSLAVKTEAPAFSCHISACTRCPWLNHFISLGLCFMVKNWGISTWITRTAFKKMGQGLLTAVSVKRHASSQEAGEKVMLSVSIIRETQMNCYTHQDDKCLNKKQTNQLGEVCLWGCGEPLCRCWWRSRMARPLWETAWGWWDGSVGGGAGVLSQEPQSRRKKLIS